VHADGRIIPLNYVSGIQADVLILLLLTSQTTSVWFQLIVQAMVIQYIDIVLVLASKTRLLYTLQTIAPKCV
jgi:hypothetical protein